MPLSPKILRRQADLVVQVVRDTAAAVASGHPADATLARFYREHPEFGSRDRRLFSQVVFAYFRWKGWLAGCAGSSMEAACILAHALEATEIHPAIALLTDSKGRFAAGITPLGNLPPAEKAAGFARMTGTPLPPLLDVIPPWCAGSLRVPPDTPPADHLRRLATTFQIPPPAWLRTRPGCRERVMELLGQGAMTAGGFGSELPRPSGERVGVRVLSPLPDALQIPRGLNLRALSPQLTGLMEIQDLASQAVGIVCAPRAGERWWDACCGSGGKALHLADLMGETGRVLATDIRAGTLDEMTRRMRASRLRSIEIRKWDGTAAPDALFDGVLVDAPCSGLGTWHRNPDARWRTSPAEIDRLATLQLGLLRTCAQRVKPGGVLVYATCTLTAPENDGVIDEFLSDGGDFLPASFPSPLDGSTCEGRLWIYPWQAGCNGMFIARFMRKT